MKRVEKKFVKIDFKAAMFVLNEDNELIVVEKDKEGAVIEENLFLDAIKGLIGEDNITISIKKENDISE